MQPLEYDTDRASDADVDELLEGTDGTDEDRQREVRGTIGGVVAIPVAFVAVVLLVAWAWPPVSLLFALTANALATP